MYGWDRNGYLKNGSLRANGASEKKEQQQNEQQSEHGEMKHFISEFAIFFNECKAEFGDDLNTNDIINLFAVYRKDRRTQKLDESKDRRMKLIEERKEAKKEKKEDKGDEPATKKQKDLITRLVKEGKIDKIPKEQWNKLTKKEASSLIDEAFGEGED